MVEFINKYVNKVIVFVVSDNLVVKVDIIGFLIIVMVVFYFVEMVIK